MPTWTDPIISSFFLLSSTLPKNRQKILYKKKVAKPTSMKIWSHRHVVIPDKCRIKLKGASLYSRATWDKHSGQDKEWSEKYHTNGNAERNLCQQEWGKQYKKIVKSHACVYLPKKLMMWTTTVILAKTALSTQVDARAIVNGTVMAAAAVGGWEIKMKTLLFRIWKLLRYLLERLTRVTKKLFFFQGGRKEEIDVFV